MSLTNRDWVFPKMTTDGGDVMRQPYRAPFGQIANPEKGSDAVPLDYLLSFLGVANSDQWLYGTGVPNDANGYDGNFYLDISNGYIYLKDSGAWVFQGTISGIISNSIITVTLAQFNALVSINSLMPGSIYVVTGCGASNDITAKVTAKSTSEVYPDAILSIEVEDYTPGSPETVSFFSMYYPSSLNPEMIIDEYGNQISKPFSSNFIFSSPSGGIFSGCHISVENSSFSTSLNTRVFSSVIEKCQFGSGQYSIYNSRISGTSSITQTGSFTNASTIDGCNIQSSSITFEDPNAGSLIGCTIINCPVVVKGNATISNWFIIGDGVTPLIFEDGDIPDSGHSIYIGRYSTATVDMTKSDPNGFCDFDAATGELTLRRMWIGRARISGAIGASGVDILNKILTPGFDPIVPLTLFEPGSLPTDVLVNSITAAPSGVGYIYGSAGYSVSQFFNQEDVFTFTWRSSISGSAAWLITNQEIII